MTQWVKPEELFQWLSVSQLVLKIIFIFYSLLGSLSEKNKRGTNWILSKVEQMIPRTCLADGSFKLDLFIIKYLFNIK